MLPRTTRLRQEGKQNVFAMLVPANMARCLAMGFGWRGEGLRSVRSVIESRERPTKTIWDAEWAARPRKLWQPKPRSFLAAWKLKRKQFQQNGKSELECIQKA